MVKFLLLIAANDEVLSHQCTSLEAEVAEQTQGELDGSNREEDVALDRAVEALVRDESRPGCAQISKNIFAQ